MNKLLFIFLMLASLPVMAQNRGQGMMNRRIEELEKVKLIETLNLDETRSIQFFSKRRDFRDKQRDLNAQLDSLSSKMRNILQNQQEKDKVKDALNQYINAEKQLSGLRNSYLAELKNILTEEELGKLIVFERDFKKDIQQMIMKRNRRMRQNSEE